MKKIITLFFCIFSFINVYSYDDMTVLALNDFHGQVEHSRNMVGAAKIASFIRAYKKNYPNLVIVSAGDNYQGTAISNISHGAVVNEFFDYIGLKFSAVGNHDFDYGQEWFKTWDKDAKFKYLTANISYKQNFLSHNLYNMLGMQAEAKSLKYTQPYGYETFANGKTIYFIGLSTIETPDTTAEKNISDLQFTNPAISANKWVNYINNYKEHNIPKPDTIVLLTHIPSETVDTNITYHIKYPSFGGKAEINYVTENVKGISALISGHSHQLVSGYSNNVAVVQGASQGKDISVLHYDCHTKPGVCKVTPEVLNLDKATVGMAGDPKVKQMVDKYYNEVKEKLTSVVTYAPLYMSNKAEDGRYNIPFTYTLANIVKEQTHADVALLNTYGIRQSLPSGEITYGILYDAMPFDNMVVTTTVKGSELIALIKHSLAPGAKEQIGVFAGVNLMVNNHDKIVSAYVNGSPIDDNKNYTIATLDFLIDGGDGFKFKNKISYDDSGISLRDYIIDYWSNHPADIADGWRNIKVSE